MTAIPTPEEMVRRAKAAYAEAGWPDVQVRAAGRHPDGWPLIRAYGLGSQAPLAVTWQAAWTAYEGRIAFWSCWNDPSLTVRDDCLAGRCHHPEGPARPPRELLNGDRR